MKKGLLFTLIAIGAVLLIIIISCVSGYNSLVNASANVDGKKAQIQTQLQRRNDLIPNLVETVKGYTTHEADVLKAISDARAKLAGSTDLNDMAQADAELTSALNRLLVVVENYPDLKANTVYIGLMDDLEGTENRIAVARKDYNDAVQIYNQNIRTFPKVILANMFGFEKADYFEAEEGAQAAPTVNFGD